MQCAPRFPSLRAGAIVGMLMLAMVGSRGNAQMAYTIARGATSIVPTRHGFLGLDFAEAKFGLTFAGFRALPCGTPSCVPNEIGFALHASGAARKLQDNVFSKVSFVPGFDVGGRVEFAFRGAGPGYDVVFVRALFTTVERKLIRFSGDTIFLGEDSQHTYAAAIGFNHAFAGATLIGVGFEGRRELSSPGLQRAREFCTPGASAGGVPVLVCADRFVAPLADVWAGQARLDLSLRVAVLGAQPNAPSLGLLSGVSLDFVEGDDTAWNVAFGPSIQLAGYTGQPVVALLFGLRDVFDANGLPADDPQRDAYLSEHLLTRLVLAVPFKVLTGK